MLNYLQRYEILQRYSILGYSIINSNEILTKSLMAKLNDIIMSYSPEYSTEPPKLLVVGAGSEMSVKEALKAGYTPEEIVNLLPEKSTPVEFGELGKRVYEKANSMSKDHYRFQKGLLDDIVKKASHKDLKRWFVVSNLSTKDLKELAAENTQYLEGKYYVPFSDIVAWKEEGLPKEMVAPLVGMLSEFGKDDNSYKQLTNMLRGSINQRINYELATIYNIDKPLGEQSQIFMEHLRDTDFIRAGQRNRVVNPDIAAPWEVNTSLMGNTTEQIKAITRMKNIYNPRYKPNKPTGGKP